MSEMVESGCKAAALEVSAEAHGAPIVRRGRLPRRDGDRRRRTPRIPRRGRAPTTPGQGPAVPPGRARRRGRRQRRRPATPRSSARVNLDARRVAFAMEPAARPDLVADVSARIVRLDGAGTRMVAPRIRSRDLGRAPAGRPAGGRLRPGRGGPGVGPGDRPRRRRRRAGGGPPVAGHLEAVDQGQDFDVRVDAASTPEALEEALAAVRAVGAGRVHCVLGAEGAATAPSAAGWPRPPRPEPIASSSPSAIPAPRTPTRSSTSSWPDSGGRARSASSPIAARPSRPPWPMPAPATPC